MVWSAYNDTGDASAARLLVAHGADVNASDDIGETALTYALRTGSDTPLVNFLRSLHAVEPLKRKTKPLPERIIPTATEALTPLIREAAQRSVDLLQRSSTAYLTHPRIRKFAQCISCHQQSLPAVAFSLARDRGLKLDDDALGRQLDAHLRRWTSRPLAHALEISIPFGSPVVQASYGLMGLSSLHYQSDEITNTYVHYVLRMQRVDGSWASYDTRPPLEDGPIVATAWALRAVTAYPISGREREIEQAIARARAWLARQEPKNQGDQVMQLLGLAWSGEKTDRLNTHVSRLLQTQRSDGGWAQLPGRETDAWATGSALYALHEAGRLPTADPAYQRGVGFLLRTQFEDGSWWVQSRSWPFQPHFNAQFPHGKDQWISAAGTAWATAALLLTIEPIRSPVSAPTGQELIAAFATASGANKDRDHTPVLVAEERSAAIDFTRDIQPILERSCIKCHSGERPKGSFNLSSRETLLKGGQSGEPAIVPGYAEDSPLIQYVSGAIEDLEMPPLMRREKFPALTAEEISLLRTWIDAGAPWPATKSVSTTTASPPSVAEITRITSAPQP